MSQVIALWKDVMQERGYFRCAERLRVVIKTVEKCNAMQKYAKSFLIFHFRNSACPICNKSLVDMSDHWKVLDNEIENTLMPEPYRDYKVNVSDCRYICMLC